MKNLVLGLAGLVAATAFGCQDPGSDPLTDPCGSPFVVDFMAAQTTRIGTVTVANSQDTLGISIRTEGGWYMKVTHVAVADSAARLPQTRSGNPIPGLFPFSRRHCPPVAHDQYSIPLSGFTARELFIAVHAEVFRRVHDDDDDKDDDDDDGKDDEKDDEKDDDDKEHESAWAAGERFRGRNWGMFFRYTLQECGPVSLKGQFRSETQANWGADPDGTNPATLLLNSFGDVFPQGLEIGSSGGKRILFTTAQAVLNFLPQSGPPAPLPGSFLNPPPPDLANVFAGQVTALTLNVEFDRFDPAFGKSNVALSALLVAEPASRLFNVSVDKVLVLSNQVLSGAANVGYSADELNEAVTRINQNFVDGTDGEFLRLP